MEMLPASRDAATHPAVHRIAPTTKSSQAPNVSGAEAGSPCPVHLLGVLSQQAREAGVIRSHFLSGTLRPREGGGTLESPYSTGGGWGFAGIDSLPVRRLMPFIETHQT